MKIKTSITLSEEILKEVDKLSDQYGNRSMLIEHALREFLGEHYLFLDNIASINL